MATNLDLASFDESYIPAGVFGTWKKGEADHGQARLAFTTLTKHLPQQIRLQLRQLAELLEVLNSCWKHKQDAGTLKESPR